MVTPDQRRPESVVSTEPLAYHLTWTTYGSWLPGDERGWVLSGHSGVRSADREVSRISEEKLKDTIVILDEQQRNAVDEVIVKHVTIRGWELHARNVRTNHVHVIVTADKDPDTVSGQFKAYASRELSKRLGRKRTWWTEGQSTRWINDRAYLEDAIRYVFEGQ